MDPVTRFHEMLREEDRFVDDCETFQKRQNERNLAKRRKEERLAKKAMTTPVEDR